MGIEDSVRAELFRWAWKNIAAVSTAFGILATFVSGIVWLVNALYDAKQQNEKLLSDARLQQERLLVETRQQNERFAHELQNNIRQGQVNICIEAYRFKLQSVSTGFSHYNDVANMLISSIPSGVCPR
jgi:hypothetical protein